MFGQMAGQISKIMMRFKDNFFELANSVYFNVINSLIYKMEN